MHDFIIKRARLVEGHQVDIVIDDGKITSVSLCNENPIDFLSAKQP